MVGFALSCLPAARWPLRSYVARLPFFCAGPRKCSHFQLERFRGPLCVRFPTGRTLAARRGERPAVLGWGLLFSGAERVPGGKAAASGRPAPQLMPQPLSEAHAQRGDAARAAAFRPEARRWRRELARASAKPARPRWPTEATDGSARGTG